MPNAGHMIPWDDFDGFFDGSRGLPAPADKDSGLGPRSLFMLPLQMQGRNQFQAAKDAPVQKNYRIGQIVPSSNTTMETEIPAMLMARQSIRPERFTFHSSRMRMKTVKKEELAAMDAESDRCAIELSDARVDVLGYACLVAIMAMGLGYHRESEKRLTGRTVENGDEHSRRDQRRRAHRGPEGDEGEARSLSSRPT